MSCGKAEGPIELDDAGKDREAVEMAAKEQEVIRNQKADLAPVLDRRDREDVRLRWRVEERCRHRSPRPIGSKSRSMAATSRLPTASTGMASRKRQRRGKAAGSCVAERLRRNRRSKRNLPS